MDSLNLHRVVMNKTYGSLVCSPCKIVKFIVEDSTVKNISCPTLMTIDDKTSSSDRFPVEVVDEEELSST